MVSSPRHPVHKRSARGPQRPRSGDTTFRDAIASLAGPDRELAERIHLVVTAAAPQLVPRIWYGMPAWTKNGTVVCFFQPAQKFKTRYATFGFQDIAQLDDGRMWPVAFAIAGLTADEETRVADLVRRAVGEEAGV